MTGRTSGQLYFEDDFGSFIEVGKFQEIEKLTASRKGRTRNSTDSMRRAPAWT